MTTSHCFHGGAFFEAIGEEFDDLRRRRAIVNADVLDAPFPPSPRVRAALRADLDWIARTSPPVHGEGLRRVISRVRGIPESSIALGAGSSDLIFRAFTHLLTKRSRVLVLDPSYGEYAHVVEHVIGATVERHELSARDHFALDLTALSRRLHSNSGRCRFDLVVLVHPNNPTGTILARPALERFLADLPVRTTVWIDEAYIDYADPALTFERFAAASSRVVVCKTLSKSYALSGLRVAYLVGPPSFVADLRRASPPWNLSLPAQIAAVAALNDEPWYTRQRARVHLWRKQLRRDLERALQGTGAIITDSCANWLLLTLRDPTLDSIRDSVRDSSRDSVRDSSRDSIVDGSDVGGAALPSAAAFLVAHCRRCGVFLRDAGATSRILAPNVVRIAVRTPAENRRIVAAIASALADRGMVQRKSMDLGIASSIARHTAGP